jgi:predicted GIY-YIG superfamily endonuclease
MKNTCVNDAIKREKEIKGWSRSKEMALISSINPTNKFLNASVIFGGKDSRVS